MQPLATSLRQQPIGTACRVCEAGSMKRSGVRPSVCLFHFPSALCWCVAWWTTSRLPLKNRSEWQRTAINGESTSVRGVANSVSSRTAKEQISAAAGLLLRARQQGGIDCVLQQRRANADSAVLSASGVTSHRQPRQCWGARVPKR